MLPVGRNWTNTPAPHEVKIAFVAAGAVEDYDDDARKRIRSKFAQIGSIVPDDAVKLTITPASVNVVAKLPAIDADSAAELASAVSARLSTATVASEIFGITVESAPSVSTAENPTYANETAAMSQGEEGGDAAPIVDVQAVSAGEGGSIEELEGLELIPVILGCVGILLCGACTITCYHRASHKEEEDQRRLDRVLPNPKQLDPVASSGQEQKAEESKPTDETDHALAP